MASGSGSGVGAATTATAAEGCESVAVVAGSAGAVDGSVVEVAMSSSLEVAASSLGH